MTRRSRGFSRTRAVRPSHALSINGTVVSPRARLGLAAPGRARRRSTMMPLRPRGLWRLRRDPKGEAPAPSAPARVQPGPPAMRCGRDDANSTPLHPRRAPLLRPVDERSRVASLPRPRGVPIRRAAWPSGHIVSPRARVERPLSPGIRPPMSKLALAPARSAPVDVVAGRRGSVSPAPARERPLRPMDEQSLEVFPPYPRGMPSCR